MMYNLAAQIHLVDIICLVIQFVYICILNGFLHPLITLLFGILTCSNVHHLRRRTSLRSVLIRQINYQLTLMLILQLIKSSFSSLPFSIFNCYQLITRNMKKSLLYQAKENLTYQICYLLFWSNYTSFFVYLYSSDIFRKQYVKTIQGIVYYIFGKRQRQRFYQPESKRLTIVPNIV